MFIIFPVAEFSVSICSAPKFIYNSDDGVPRILIKEKDTSNESNKTGWCEHLIRLKSIKFLTNIYLKVKSK